MKSPKKIVQEGYDKVSHTYRADELSPTDESYQKYKSWVDGLAQYLKKGQTALDLGCGNGVPSTQFLAQNFKVTGVDISPVQIERAQKLVPEASFICGDMSTLNFAPEEFNAIVCLYAIIHIPLEEQAELLEKIYQWLKPEGFLMLVTGHNEWTGEASDWLGVEGGDMYWSHADRKTYLQWLQDVGFSILWDRYIPEGDGGHTLIFARKNKHE